MRRDGASLCRRGVFPPQEWAVQPKGRETLPLRCAEVNSSGFEDFLAPASNFPLKFRPDSRKSPENRCLPLKTCLTPQARECYFKHKQSLDP